MSSGFTLTDLALKFADKYFDNTIQKTAFIRKMPNGKWKVVSRKGKTLGIFPTKEKAVKRLRQIEFFKHHKEAATNDNAIDLTHLNELTFSAVVRELRSQCEEKVVHQFLSIFKQLFDALVLLSENHPDEKAMPAALLLLGKLYPLELRND